MDLANENGKNSKNFIGVKTEVMIKVSAMRVCIIILIVQMK